MLPKRAISWGTLISAVLLSGCALVPGLRVSASGDHSDETTPYKVVPITAQVVVDQRAALALSEKGDQGLRAADPTRPPAEYLIGAGDVLQIVVWDHMELTNPFGAVTRDPVSSGQLVAADGSVFFPYAGVIQVAGKTVQQVRNELSDKLKAVVTKPQVDVRVAAFRAGRIQVTGEVQSPGLVTVDDTVKGVLEAINERGGLNPTASRRTALLIRSGKSYEIDTSGLLSGARPAVNPTLLPGDIVHVPDSGDDQVFVLGELVKQGPVIIGQQQMTLTEALTKSGGLDRVSAADSGVLVFRRVRGANQPAQIFSIDMSQPQGVLLAGEFPLLPRDVVYVKATKFSQYNLIINQLLPTITAVYQIDALTN